MRLFNVGGEMEDCKAPLTCDFCHYPVKDLKEYDRLKNGLRDGTKKLLCGICAGTMAGNALDYPTNYDHDTKAILQTIAFVGNTILAAIKDRT